MNAGAVNAEARNPLRWFNSAHLPPHLAIVVEPFERTAHALVDLLGQDGMTHEEAAKCLDDLVAAKDHAVRVAVDLWADLHPGQTHPANTPTRPDGTPLAPAEGAVEGRTEAP